MIQELFTDSIEQRCENCGEVRKVEFSRLQVGVQNGEFCDTHVIPLPTCETCKAVEYLIATREAESEHPEPGSLSHKHHILVDLFHQRLVEVGRVVEDLDPKTIKTRKHSEDELKLWFKQGLRLELQASET